MHLRRCGEWCGKGAGEGTVHSRPSAPSPGPCRRWLTAARAPFQLQMNRKQKLGSPEQEMRPMPGYHVENLAIVGRNPGSAGATRQSKKVHGEKRQVHTHKRPARNGSWPGFRQYDVAGPTWAKPEVRQTQRCAKIAPVPTRNGNAATTK